MNNTMIFSWKGLALAPLPIPFIYSIAFVILAQSGSPLILFLILFAFGGFVSYCTTLCLFLPCLFLISKLKLLTVHLTCLLGMVLGGFIYLPIAWQIFLTSGDNSGPPQGSFGDYLWRDLLFEPITWAFPVGGLVTALIYWVLVNQQPKGND
jgi:hypothetical protein